MPKSAPSTGKKINATRSDASSTKISVNGKYFMNSPARSCQNKNGINAASVVAVDVTTGQSMRYDASAYSD